MTQSAGSVPLSLRLRFVCKIKPSDLNISTERCEQGQPLARKVQGPHNVFTKPWMTKRAPSGCLFAKQELCICTVHVVDLSRPNQSGRPGYH